MVQATSKCMHRLKFNCESMRTPEAFIEFKFKDKMLRSTSDLDVGNANELKITVTVEEAADVDVPELLNVALISENDQIVKQVNGDETRTITLTASLEQDSFVILIYPIWKKGYNRESNVTVSGSEI